MQANNKKDPLNKYKKKLQSLRFLGAGHKRVLVPKSEFTKSDLLSKYGFKESRVSVGEKGEVSKTSYRPPATGHHIHSHRNYWVLHRDEYKPGIRHIALEGLPAMVKKIKSKESESTVKELKTRNKRID